MAPKPLLSAAIEHNGYFVTLAQDATNKIVEYDNIDFKIVEKQLNKKLNQGVVEMLYFAALFHEAMEGCKLPSSFQFSTPEKMKDRLAMRAAKALFSNLIEPAYHNLLDELESASKTIVLQDNREENYVGKSSLGRQFVDFGLAGEGGEYMDIVKPLIAKHRIIADHTAVQEYVKAYVEMRRDIQFLFNAEVNYSPVVSKLTNLVYKAGVLETVKLAGWHQYTKKEGVTELLEAANLFSRFV